MPVYARQLYLGPSLFEVQRCQPESPLKNLYTCTVRKDLNNNSEIFEAMLIQPCFYEVNRAVQEILFSSWHSCKKCKEYSCAHCFHFLPRCLAKSLMVFKVDLWHADRHNSFFQHCQEPAAWMMSPFYVQYVCVYGEHVEAKTPRKRMMVGALLKQDLLTHALLNSWSSSNPNYLFPKSVLAQPQLND